MKKSDFPPIPKALMDELQKRFPDTLPEIFTPLEQIRALQGEQRVIRFLKHQYELQNTTVLEKK